MHAGAHLWSRIDSDSAVRDAAEQSGLSLSVAVILQNCETAGEWKRVGLNEVYDACGWSPSTEWKDDSVAIV